MEKENKFAIDPVVVGSLAMAGASFHPAVNSVISSNPETVSSVIAIIVSILKLFVKKR